MRHWGVSRVLNGFFVLDIAIDRDTDGIYVLNVCAHQFNFRRSSTRS